MTVNLVVGGGACDAADRYKHCRLRDSPVSGWAGAEGARQERQHPEAWENYGYQLEHKLRPRPPAPVWVRRGSICWPSSCTRIFGLVDDLYHSSGHVFWDEEVALRRFLVSSWDQVLGPGSIYSAPEALPPD